MTGSKCDDDMVGGSALWHDTQRCDGDDDTVGGGVPAT